MSSHMPVPAFSTCEHTRFFIGGREGEGEGEGEGGEGEGRRVMYFVWISVVVIFS